MQNTQRMNQALVAQILPHLLFQRIERGQHIALGVHDAFGLSSSAGSEDDLQRRIPRQAGQGKIIRSGKRTREIGKTKRGNTRMELLQQRQVAHQQPGLDLGHHPPGKLHAPGRIQGNCNDSAQDASKESRHPLRGIVAPEQNPLSRLDARLLIGVGAARAQLAQFGVGGGKAAVPAVGDDRDLFPITPKVGDKRGQVRSHPFSVAQDGA
jgi:hypothetical protein